MSTTWTLAVYSLTPAALELLVREAERWGCETDLELPTALLTVSGEAAMRVASTAVLCGVVPHAQEAGGMVMTMGEQ